MIQPSKSIKASEDGEEDPQETFKKEVPFAKFLQRFFKPGKINEESFKVLPCDFLILSGSCIVNESILTGESLPQIKDSISYAPLDQNLDIKKAHKSSILFCGTEVLQITSSEKLPAFMKTQHTPTNSCIGYVLRTGFNTAKGKLTRTVLYSSENIQFKQKDAFLLIFFLLIFAISSASYVLYHGLQDTTRDKGKLFIRCILIITTVVPPELPMILSIAVNSSLLYLQRKKLFCTEPFRIPLAGTVQICAFDKTGTLTGDTMVMRGIINPEDLYSNDFKNPKLDFKIVSEESAFVLGGYHSLFQLDSKMTGDPIELAFFTSSN